MYTTTDISKCLGIKRERLKIWMSKGFIKPTETASGPGTKNLFTITDLYLLKLFASLVERGFPREEAAERITITRVSLNPDVIGNLALIGFIRHDQADKNRGYPEILYADSPEDFIKDSPFFMDEFFKYGCDDILIFNFKKIREAVNKALL
jgi:DNA-binding transcriptional MerR regulator